MNDSHHLARFEAHQNDFVRALSEIESGRKRSHWMWFVFPQVSGLGISETSRAYAIGSIGEAEAFLNHPALGSSYREIVDAVWDQVVNHGVTIRALFGSPDDVKLVSSLTLFAAIGRRLPPSPDITALVAHAEEILEAAYAQGLAKCTTTARFLYNVFG
jgi:uncharacterized protein (DUF1810 family)